MDASNVFLLRIAVLRCQWLSVFTRDLCRRQGEEMKSEKGASLIETMVALALLGIIGVTFLMVLATTSNTRFIADERASARILAESQMENVRKQNYAFSYDPVPIPDEYASYSAVIDVDSMRNGNIQKITVTIKHKSREVTTLEGYKVNR